MVEQQQREREAHQDGLREQAEHEAGDHRRMAKRAGALRVTRVCEQARHPEPDGEHALALGDPRHGLDVQRVDREDRGDEGARAVATGHPPQRREEQAGRERVERQVREQEAPGPLAPERVVDAVGEQRERDQVREEGRREGVEERARGEPLVEGLVADDVDAVVEVHEIVVAHLLEDGDHQQHEAAGDPCRRGAAHGVSARPSAADPPRGEPPRGRGPRGGSR